MRRQRGFTLIEMVMVIAVLGVIFTILIGITSSVVSQQRYQVTRARFANMDTALSIFVSQYKRLPCPADGRLASSDSNAGLELATGSGTTRTCTGNQRYGVAPWRALGLTATDAEDGWGGRLTYRAGPDLVWDGALNFSSCDPAGIGGINATAPIPPWCILAGTTGAQCNSGNLGSCTPPSTALQQDNTKGIPVENVGASVLMDPRGAGGTTPSTGAAYVLVSHGPEGGGAYSGEGILLSSSVAARTMVAKKFAAIAYAAPSALPAALSWYMVDDVINGTATTAHFDDMVSRPGILALATKAGLGPRSH